MSSPRYQEAVELAHAWHRGQTRKGTDIPYVEHVLAVSALVREHGGSEDEAIAALLHDALEDAPDQPEADRRREEMLRRFGAAVLSTVEACTDADPAAKAGEKDLDDEGRSAAWLVRKKRYVDHLGGAARSALLVASADKVHNAGTIVQHLHAVGPRVFERFNAKREGTLWYYRTVLAALEAKVGDEPRIAGLVRELEPLVAEMSEG
jgi:(p)ppGpp synthase/HD superfamily hydrolase